MMSEKKFNIRKSQIIVSAVVCILLLITVLVLVQTNEYQQKLHVLETQVIPSFSVQIDNLSGENEKLASENKLLRQQLKDSEQEIAKRDEIASRNTKTIPYFDVLKDDLTEAQFYIEKPYNENEISPGVLFSNQINISSWTDYFQPSVEQFGEIIPRLNQILKEYREVTELVTPLVGISKLKPYTTTQWTDQYIGFSNIMTSLKLYEANWRYIQVRSQFLIGIYQYEYGEIDQNQLDLLRDAYLQLKDKLSEALKGITFAD